MTAEVVGGVVEGAAVLVEGVPVGQPVLAQGGGVRAAAGAGGGGAGASLHLHHPSVLLASLSTTGRKQGTVSQSGEGESVRECSGVKPLGGKRERESVCVRARARARVCACMCVCVTVSM